MAYRLILTLLLANLVQGSASADETRVKVIALFADKALLQVGEQQKIVRKGETFEGVLLQSASGRGAVVVVDGNRMKLGLNQSIAGNFKKPQRNGLKIYPDALGMYYIDGEINGLKTRFLVDTGATYVTLSGNRARQLGIDFRRGSPSQVQTAAAVVTAWTVKLDSVSVGGIRMSNIDATVIAGDQPFEVLLGNSFLQHTRMQKAGAVLELNKRF